MFGNIGTISQAVGLTDCVMCPSFESVAIGKNDRYINGAVIWCIFSFPTFLGLYFWGFKNRKCRVLGVWGDVDSRAHGLLTEFDLLGALN